MDKEYWTNVLKFVVACVAGGIGLSIACMIIMISIEFTARIVGAW